MYQQNKPVLDEDSNIAYKFNVWNDKENVSDYKEIDIKERFDFLYRLGFDLTDTRHEGYKYLDINNDLVIENIKWKQHKKDDIRQGYANNCFSTNNDFKEYFESLNVRLAVSRHYNNQYSNRLHAKSYTKKGEEKILFTSREKANIYYKIGKVYGISRHEYSRVVAFDIDAHPLNNDPESLQEARDTAYRTLQLLLKEFNYQRPIYSEISKNGGFHIYYRFDQAVCQKDIDNFIKQFNTTYNLSLESNRTTKIFQLPDSIFYCPIKFNNLENRSTEFELYQTTGEYLADVKHFNKPIDYNAFLKQQSIHPFDYPQIDTKTDIPLYQNSYSRRRHKHNTSQKSDFSYSPGTRWDTWYKKGYGYRYYEMSKGNYNAFRYLVLLFNKGSKDMASHPEKYIHELWKFCERTYKGQSGLELKYYNKKTTSLPPTLADNAVHVDQHLNNYSKQLLNSIAQNITVKHFSNSRYKKNYDNYLFQVTQTLKSAIIGRMIFEHEANYKRSISQGVRISNRKRKEYEEGIQFFKTAIGPLLKDTYKFKMNHGIVFDAVINSLPFIRKYKNHCFRSGNSSFASATIYKIDEHSGLSFYDNLYKNLEKTLFILVTDFKNNSYSGNDSLNNSKKKSIFNIDQYFNADLVSDTGCMLKGFEFFET